MYPLQFTRIHLHGHDIIGVAGSTVFLTVYAAEMHPFEVKEGEKQFYLEHHSQLLIFETTGYNKLIDPFHLQSLYAAVLWYGRTRLHCRNIRVSLTDPRMNKANHTD